MAKTKWQHLMKMGTGKEVHWSWFCFIILFMAGFVTLLVWLANTPEKPTFSIEKFYVPALNKAAKDTLNNTVIFDLQLKNPGSRIYYDALNVTLYYGHNLTFSVGSVSIPGFRQGLQKKTHRVETVKTNGVPWKTAVEEASKGTTTFRLHLSTVVKYTIFSMKGGRHKMRLGADVQVNDQGIKSTEKGIQLISA